MGMKRLMGGVALAVAAAMTLALGATASAQSAAYKAPRTPDGLPDLEGIWQVMSTAAWDLEAHEARIGVPAGQSVVEGGAIPYQPWALEQRRKNVASRATADPETKCWAPGVPRLTYMPFPLKIVQTPRYMAIVHEYGHHQRFIYTDGTKHPADVPMLIGHSIGRWEGDTFVADTIDLTDQT